MSSRTPRAGIVLRTNTSTVPGIRPRWRRGRYGRPQLGLDVSWHQDGQRRFTTLPANLDGMRRALALREQAIGQVIGVSARKALAAMLELAR